MNGATILWKKGPRHPRAKRHPSPLSRRKQANTDVQRPKGRMFGIIFRTSSEICVFIRAREPKRGKSNPFHTLVGAPWFVSERSPSISWPQPCNMPVSGSTVYLVGGIEVAWHELLGRVWEPSARNSLSRISGEMIYGRGLLSSSVLREFSAWRYRAKMTTLAHQFMKCSV